MKNLFRKYVYILTIIALGLLSILFYRGFHTSTKNTIPLPVADENWKAPDSSKIPHTDAGNLIRYGKALISNTALFLGPRGMVAKISNGMNCKNCHLDAGTRLYAGSFALVANSYPKFRERSGRIESVEFRINECMERSMNGEKLDSLSTEMKAMKAYLLWVGKDVNKGDKPAGTGTIEIPYLQRAASIDNGKIIYKDKCQKCHGINGEGVLSPDSVGYGYPPLWGHHSFNVSAGIYRISRMASFIKYNMPFQSIAARPQLTDEEAWDVAAFIISNSRPQKTFKYDWPNINTKPIDYALPPFADSFSSRQHQYGPFEPILAARNNAQKKPLKN